MSSSRPQRLERQSNFAVRSWRTLMPAQQRTAAAALVLLVTLGSPWYSKTLTTVATSKSIEQSVSGLQAFSFVEAAVLLVALSVLALVWGRATGRVFSLPFKDGTLVSAAAIWICFLITYRVFSRPGAEEASGIATQVGINWGIFASLGAAILLLVTGLDQRSTHAEANTTEERWQATHPSDDSSQAHTVQNRAERREPGESRPQPLFDDEETVVSSSGTRPRRPVPPAGTPAPRRRRPSGPDEATALDRQQATEVLRDAGLYGDDR